MEDVVAYNNLVFLENCAPETRHVNLHTNASGDQEVTTWLNDTYFDHIERLAGK